jgi:hypothetical protein
MPKVYLKLFIVMKILLSFLCQARQRKDERKRWRADTHAASRYRSAADRRPPPAARATPLDVVTIISKNAAKRRTRLRIFHFPFSIFHFS